MGKARILFIAVLAAFVLLRPCAAGALPRGYYYSFNSTANTNSQVAVALNTTGNVALMLMTSSQYQLFRSNRYTPMIYNRSVGSGDYVFNVSPGTYRVVVDALYGEVMAQASSLTVPSGAGSLVEINTRYSVPISLANYSDVSMTLLGASPVIGRIFGYNLTFDENSTYSSWYFYLNSGNYYLNLSSFAPTQAFLYLNLTPALANPLYGHNSSRAQSVGVVSYGLYNVSGRLIPQPIETNLVEGSAMIYSLLSYNASPPDSASAYGASLQLNVLMKVFSGGRNYTYWLQEIRAFDTRNRTDFIYDNIWNNTVFGANMSSSTVSGPGKIHSGEPDKYFSYSRSYYFYSPSAKVPYSMPLNVSPVIKVSIQNGNPVVSFGTSTASGDSYYESVTLQIPASSAYILVTPFYNTPNSAGKSGVRYDAEFVFAGEESDEISYFSRLNSSIWIYYAGSNGRLLPFPSAYTFGSDTGEASQNLSVSAAAHGAWVGTGTLNPATDIILAGALNNLTTSTVATTTSTVIATTSTAIATSTVPPVTAQTTARTTLPTTVPATSAYTTVAAYNASNVTAPAGQSGGQGSSSGIGTDVIVIVFALAVLYFLSRKVAKGKAPSR